MSSAEERIAVLETEFKNMINNLSSINKNIEGINTTLNTISLKMAEGRGAIRTGSWVARTMYGLLCALVGLCGGIFGGNVAAAQKVASVADKVIK